MAEVLIDVVFHRDPCMCGLAPELAKQVAPHRRTCPWLNMWDLITLFMVADLEPPEEGIEVRLTAVLWKEQYQGPDPAGMKIATPQEAARIKYERMRRRNRGRGMSWDDD